MLRNFIRLILIEGKIDDLKKKYPEFNEQIDRLSSQIKHKYVPWAIKQISSGSNLIDLIPTIDYFDKNIIKFDVKDINQYTGKSLENKVKEVSQTISKKQQARDIKTSGSETLHEDDQQKLIYIKNKEAAAKYGAGAKWCITMMDAKHWENYEDHNVVIYYLLQKKNFTDDLSKIAFAVQRNQENEILRTDIFDAKDHLINSDNRLKSLPANFNLDEMIKIVEVDAAKRPTSAYIQLLKNAETNEITLEKFKELPINRQSELLDYLICSPQDYQKFDNEVFNNFLRRFIDEDFEDGTLTEKTKKLLMKAGFSSEDFIEFNDYFYEAFRNKEEAYYSPEPSNLEDFSLNLQHINRLLTKINPKIYLLPEEIFDVQRWEEGLEERERHLGEE